MNSKAPSTTATAQRSYEDFEPIANWVTEEAKTLEIHLPEFKKEQIKVQLDNLGNLKITGERPLEGTKWSRFRINLRIPKECNFNEIHAKFNNNVLQVVLPKKTIKTSAQDQPVIQAQEPSIAQKIANEAKPDKTNEQIASAATKDHKAKGQRNVVENADVRSKNATGKGLWSSRSYQVGVGGYVVRLSKPRKVLVNVAAAIVMVVAAGVYAVYRVRSSSGESGASS